jgi:galactokinase/mevalonate kinase-like predicted kinase
MQLPCLSDGQVVVASGDVLLSFDASKVAFSDSGVTGLAYPGPVEVASNHGVYIVPQTQSGEHLRRVADFLQKPTYDELKECNGLDTANRAFIDTGVMNFGIDAIKVLMRASGVSLKNGKVVVEKDSFCENLINANVQLDIYKEIPFAMLGKTVAAFSVPPQAASSVPPPSFTNALQEIPFFVYLLPHCEFFHIGTSKQLLQNFHTINYTASTYSFQNFSKSKALDKSGLGNAFVYNSLINTASIKVSGSSLIEGCYLEGEILLEGENILTGIPKGAGNIKLQKGICVTCIPVYNRVEHAAGLLENGWVSIIYGIEDDFKKLAEDDAAPKASKCASLRLNEVSTFLNDTFRSWMEYKKISPTDLWEDNEPHELWNARLFPFSTDPAESMRISLSLQVEHAASLLYQWRESPRMSLRQILESVDYERFLNNYSDLCKKINLENLATTLTPKSNLSSEEILSWCAETNDYTTAVENTLALIEQSDDTLFQARLYKLLSNILRKAHEHKKDIDFEILPAIQKVVSGLSSCRVAPLSSSKIRSVGALSPTENNLTSLSESLEDIAFELVREAVGKGLTLENNQPRPLGWEKQRIQICSDEVVWVCAPARLDFAGGWSDTPPYCLEHGGSVLNAAVKLNGQYPIQVIGKINPEPCIKINSIDLGERVIVSETSEMLSFSDPSDWSSLPKAAFVAIGIIPENTELNLQELGVGIDLTLFSAVPSGSGLGTSSILGSAIIACLSRMLGQELTQGDLFNRTLYMEQLMTTGGGWQDQIGGVVGGVKLITTEPGLFQVPRISWTDLKVRPNMDLSERFLLYYTGYRRMAKNILRNIVWKYLDRDAVTLKTISQLRERSFEMKEQLDHRNIDAFGKKIVEVWELNKTLDPGTSNEEIEAILSKINNLIYGAKLLGAGGGGFLFIVTKGVNQARKIRRILTEEPPNERARFFDFDVDMEGLKVSVL